MIAFLGLGLLGSNFVRAMLKRGESVHVWNRSPDKARALEADGAIAFDDPAAAVQGTTRVHVCLSDDAAVDDVLERAHEGMAPGTVIVDHTTTSAAGAAARAARWAERGVGYLHAPVFMGPQNALDATGTMIASGDAEIFDRLKPALEPMCGRLVYLGPATDRAAGVKLIGNLFLISLTAGLSDAFALGQALGVPNEQVAELFKMFSLDAIVPARVQRMQERDHSQASFNLAMARKDTRLMIEAADGQRVPLTILPAIADEMDRWLDRGHAADDWIVITRDAVGG